jgi:hypothetical protein
MSATVALVRLALRGASTPLRFICGSSPEGVLVCGLAAPCVARTQEWRRQVRFVRIGGTSSFQMHLGIGSGEMRHMQRFDGVGAGFRGDAALLSAVSCSRVGYWSRGAHYPSGAVPSRITRRSARNTWGFAVRAPSRERNHGSWGRGRNVMSATMPLIRVGLRGAGRQRGIGGYFTEAAAPVQVRARIGESFTAGSPGRGPGDESAGWCSELRLERTPRAASAD